ncbi:MAG: aldo/keto reductase [Pseudomonadota bacterium]|nr:aldo/keto reductase [Pseudomonadota bacterium]
MDRRRALGFLAAACAAGTLPARAQAPALHARTVAASGEKIPVVGLGTWLTFDVGGADSGPRRARGEILQAFFASGGRLVDSSPMYGSSEEVIGAELARTPAPRLFAATKVWTVGGLAGRRQMEHSRGLWRVPRFDLMQVHNLLDWESHWPTLKAWKAEGRMRHIGMTTSHGRRHDDLEGLLRRERMDFVQVTYNLNDREVERVLLPLAAERGTAVIVNRPFDGGSLFGAKTARPLPGWAAEIGCRSWAEAFLKWVAAHPAVTCAIPATSRLAHLHENMRALAGPLPDAALRRRIADDYARM